MIGEAIGILAASGLLGWTYAETAGMSEGKKISRIANNCGLYVKEGKKMQTIQLLRKSRKTWGVEYVFRIPLGKSFKDFQDKKSVLEDGLNNRRSLWEFSGRELWLLVERILRKEVALQEVARELRKLRGLHKRKEIIMEYDGTLLIRVYYEPAKEQFMYDKALLESAKGWRVCIGDAREGLIWHDFDKLPHFIVAGTTRYGKSVFLKNIITTLIYNKPEHVRLHLMDLKGGLAFNRFANVKQVVGVAKDVDESLSMLRRIAAEMKIRQRDYLVKGYEDITESGTKSRDFIIVDEAAELSSAGTHIDKVKKQECENILSEIARIGGGLGYRLVYATQYPTGDVLPRQIKQNAPAKLCYLLGSEIASKVVLDESGAESLPLIKGRGIYMTDRKYIVQSPYITNEFIQEVITPHITIKPRQEGGSYEKPTGGTNRTDTLVIENA